VEARARELHLRRFGGEPAAVVVAPGRINIIGEHTDYAGGLCLPAAVDRYLAAAVSASPRLELVSEAMGEALVADPPAAGPRGDWGDLAIGVAAELARAGAPPGFRVAIASDIPVGSGLSSSAALAVALASAALQLAGMATVPMDIARLCRRVENDFLAVPSGLMDQVACMLGREGAALLFDARQEIVTPVPLPGGVAWLVCESGVGRTLRDTGYTDRPAEAAEALRLAQGLRPEIGRLGDLSPAEVEALGLPPPLDRRARHVAGEDLRVRLAVACIEAGNLEALGQLMLTSHHSLGRDCEVSTPELDDLVEVAVAAGCRGARLLGAGFGGSVLALVEARSAEHVAARITRRYRPPQGGPATVHVVTAVDGVAAG
jgi:galactokinase